MTQTSGPDGSGGQILIVDKLRENSDREDLKNNSRHLMSGLLDPWDSRLSPDCNRSGCGAGQ